MALKIVIAQPDVWLTLQLVYEVFGRVIDVSTPVFRYALQYNHVSVSQESGARVGLPVYDWHVDEQVTLT